MGARSDLSRLAVSGLFVFVSACSEPPTAPGPQPPPPPVVPPPVISQGQGQVWLRSASPEPGGKVPIHDCTYDVEESGSNYQMCGLALMIFDVAFEGEIAQAAASVRFFRGSQLCARGSAIPYFGQPFTAGSRASFVVTIISLSEVGGPIACPLPAETTRMVVEFVEPRTAAPLLTRELAHTYTFVAR